MIKKSRVKFDARLNFALSSDMKSNLIAIANLADDDIAEVLRRMIKRETPFFMQYASQHGSLPNGETQVTQ